jgi:hypothetical protein
LSTLILLKMAERREAKSAKRRFATKKLIFFKTKFRFALFALLLLVVTVPLRPVECANGRTVAVLTNAPVVICENADIAVVKSDKE